MLCWHSNKNSVKYRKISSKLFFISFAIVHLSLFKYLDDPFNKTGFFVTINPGISLFPLNKYHNVV